MPVVQLARGVVCRIEPSAAQCQKHTGTLTDTLGCVSRRGAAAEHDAAAHRERVYSLCEARCTGYLGPRRPSPRPGGHSLHAPSSPCVRCTAPWGVPAPHHQPACRRCSLTQARRCASRRRLALPKHGCERTTAGGPWAGMAADDSERMEKPRNRRAYAHCPGGPPGGDQPP